jgi:hypothetical protein
MSSVLYIYHDTQTSSGIVYSIYSIKTSVYAKKRERVRSSKPWKTAVPAENLSSQIRSMHTSTFTDDPEQN